LYILSGHPIQLDQDEIIEILDLSKALDPELHESMVNSDIKIFEKSFEESVSYFKLLENLEKIRHTNCPDPSTLPVYDRKSVTITSSVVKSSKDDKSSNMWWHYCDKKNCNTADCRAIGKLKLQKKALFEAKSAPEKNSLAFLFEEIKSLKKQFKLKRTERSKKSTKKSWIPLLSSLRKLIQLQKGMKVRTMSTFSFI
jgi:hypothetical protein